MALKVTLLASTLAIRPKGYVETLRETRSTIHSERDVVCFNDELDQTNLTEIGGLRHGTGGVLG